MTFGVFLFTGLSILLTGPARASSPLSPDQKAFESFETSGGLYGVEWNFPSGGGTLVPGTDYIYSSTYGAFKQSPSVAPQLLTMTKTSLDAALKIPAMTSTTYVVQNGQIITEGTVYQERVSYKNSTINLDYLAADGQTSLISTALSKIVVVPLRGFMAQSPQQFASEYPLNKWISLHNFVNNAKWLPGSAFLMRNETRAKDVLFASDCANTKTVSPATSPLPKACQPGTLDHFFPVRFDYAGFGHIYEFDQAADGVIQTVQGVRVWIANTPLPQRDQRTRAYRAFFELGGSVYMGLFEKKGTPFIVKQTDGSDVLYELSLNAAAVASIQKALITGTVVAGTWPGAPTTVATTTDLFGIGGHGVNGSLSPQDLRTHYHIPKNLTGAGQTVAIIDIHGGGDVTNQLNVFSRHFGLPECNAANPCFATVDLSQGKTSTDADWGSEIALDTQMVHAIAPRAKIVLVLPPTNDVGGLAQAIDYAATIPGLTAISMSFEYSGLWDQVTQNAKFLSYQKNLGLMAFASSGDDGYLTTAPYPASSPSVTVVGGTTIRNVNRPSADHVWMYSGGGTATITMPEWQNHFLPSSLVTLNSGHRAFPDVAAVADGQHSAFGIYYNGAWSMDGGTSASAPLWAGLGALLAEDFAHKGASLAALIKATPGGFNELLYEAKAKQRHAFYDFVTGTNNVWYASCDVCQASAVFNDITGLGSPDVTALFAEFH